ncbi:MAG: ECF transporter S component [Defluviitaleaceae bacterium]|nr:ECF transporter S component [Defluviitaleaceae bacterium]
MNTWSESKKIAVTGMLGAIIFILAFTPLGFIPLPIVNATTIHIPVIIGAILLGPKHGAILGFMFGLASLLRNTFAPTAASFVFSPFYTLPGEESGSWWALAVVFIPRIMVGIVPWFCYQGLRKFMPKKLDTISWGLTGIVGSMTNTLLVLNFIYLFFREPYASVVNQPLDAVYTFIMGLIVANGIPEAIVAGILVAALGRAFVAALKLSQN